MPIPPITYDDLQGVSYDDLYTYDDPLFNVRTDAAYSGGSITRDGSRLYMAWAKGDTPEIDTEFARDLFVRTAVAGDWGTTTFGQVWSDNSAQFSTDGTYGLIAASVVNTLYEAVISGVTSRDFDIGVKFQLPVLFTGAKGAFYIIARYVDANNYLRFRMDFNTDQVTGYAIEQKVAGVFTTVGSGLFLTAFHTTTDWFWLRAQGVAEKVSMKAWVDGEPEPRWFERTVDDTGYNTTVGQVGVGFTLFTSNTNSLPYTAYVSVFFSGISDEYAVGAMRTSSSLDDGLPTEVTNTGNIGVNEAVAELRGPIGTASNVFFSTFRTDQPYNDIPRDIASVSVNSGVVTSDGVRSGRVFTGIMADVPTPTDGATLKAISRTRLDLSTLVQPPAVHGFYEGAEATWVIGYALWKSGVNIVPPLIPGCRLYFPFNGSCHQYLPDTNYAGFTIAMYQYYSLATGTLSPGQWIDGPFPGTAAPDLAFNATRTRKIQSNPTNIKFAPGDDFLSTTGNKGRISFWIKGDATDIANSMDPSTSYLMLFGMSNGGSRFVNVGIGAGDRQPFLWIGDGTNQSIVRAAYTLPSDGEWHFIGASWNIAGNAMRIIIDNADLSFTAGGLSTANLATNDDVQFPNIKAYLPIAELRFTTGAFAPAAQGAWDHKQTWTRGAITRRSILTLDSVAVPQPMQAYDLISQYARGEFATTGFDNYDRFLYLPVPYWVEAEQLTVNEPLSTMTNLGKDFEPIRDVTKIYNQVSVGYTQSKVQEQWLPVFESSELITILHGTSFVEVTFQAPVVELRGTTISVMTGPQLAATPPSASNAIHYITANAVVEGNSTYATSAVLTATIDEWTPGGAVIKFVNLGQVLYVANDVNLPGLGIAAKKVIAVTASVSADNPQSVAVRGTRMLATSLPGIQLREDALKMARELVARLSQARTSFTSSVFGDTRRAPGQLVTVTDPDQTAVNGNFRLTGVSTTQDGHKIDQGITAVSVLPIFVWGESQWGNAVWGEGT